MKVKTIKEGDEFKYVILDDKDQVVNESPETYKTDADAKEAGNTQKFLLNDESSNYSGNTLLG